MACEVVAKSIEYPASDVGDLQSTPFANVDARSRNNND
jgi:hypothetical protein